MDRFYYDIVMHCIVFYCDICIAACIALWRSIFGNEPSVIIYLFNCFSLNITRVAYLNTISWYKWAQEQPTVPCTIGRFTGVSDPKPLNLFEMVTCLHTDSADIYSLTHMVSPMQSSSTKRQHHAYVGQMETLTVNMAQSYVTNNKL